MLQLSPALVDRVHEDCGHVLGLRGHAGVGAAHQREVPQPQRPQLVYRDGRLGAAEVDLGQPPTVTTIIQQCSNNQGRLSWVGISSDACTCGVRVGLGGPWAAYGGCRAGHSADAITVHRCVGGAWQWHAGSDAALMWLPCMHAPG